MSNWCQRVQSPRPSSRGMLGKTLIFPGFGQVSKIFSVNPNFSFRISLLDPREEYWTIKEAKTSPWAFFLFPLLPPLISFRNSKPWERSLCSSARGIINSREMHSRGLASLCCLLELALILDRGTRPGTAP